MQIEINEEPMTSLGEYARISIAFEVDRVFEVTAKDEGLGGLVLSERRLGARYVKDYDELESPARWARRFDLSNWGLLSARAGGRRVGGAVIAFDTRGIVMLEGRKDLAVLWDIRVDAELRGLGIGRALFRAVEKWARSRGCQWLKIETQNVNVPACKFYVKQRCTLGAIHRFAYPDLPEEIQLLWYKSLHAVDD
jgi:GNAT superfamily N-acetyltransferase